MSSLHPNVGSDSSVRTLPEPAPRRPRQGRKQNNYESPVPSQRTQPESEDDYDSIESGNSPGTCRENGRHRVNIRYTRNGEIPIAILNESDYSGYCEGAINTSPQRPWKQTDIFKRKRRNRTIRFVLLGFLIGFILGVLVCTISWLFAEKLKDSKIFCEIKQEANVGDNDRPPNGEGTTTIRPDTTQTLPSGTITSYTSVKATSSHTTVADVTTPVIKTSTSRSSVADVSNATKKDSTTWTYVSDVSTASINFSTPHSSVADVSNATIKNSTPWSSVADVSNATIKDSTTRTYVADVSTASINISTPRSSVADVSNATIKTSTSQSSVVDASTPVINTSTPHSSVAHVSTVTINASTLPDVDTTTGTAENFTTDNKTENSNTKQPSTTQMQPSSTLIGSTVTDNVSTATPTTTTATSSSTPNVSSSNLTISVHNGKKRSADMNPGGYVYTRWGSFNCPEHSEQIYKGFMAGGHYKHPGGAINTICLPEVLEWGNHRDGPDVDRALVYGTEYGSNDDTFSKLNGENLRNKDVPCTVCQATGRTSHLMVPAKTSCLPDWTEEYNGYMMGSAYLHSHASQLVCVDSSPDHVTNTDIASGGNYLYFAEIRTGILPTPSYVNGREIPCVVCTK